MIDCGVGHQPKTCLAVPFPEDNIFGHGGGFELLFGTQVEDLNSSGLSLEGNDLLVPVHDGAICVDGSLDDFIVVLEINDDNLRFVFIINFLSYANIVI
jgi:hypothetical protein